MAVRIADAQQNREAKEEAVWRAIRPSVDNLIELKQQIDVLTERKKTLEQAVKSSAFGTHTYEDGVRITVSSGSTQTRVDSRILKAKYPNIYKKVLTQSDVPGRVTITVPKTDKTKVGAAE